MKKRMFAMLLALVMVVSMLPFAAMAAENECEHKQTYLEKEESTCIQNGVIYCFCKDCGKTMWGKKKDLAPHTYGADYKCTVCGTACKNHAYGSESRVEATCTKEGSVTKTCTECGYVKPVKTLKAPGHKFTIDVISLAATCTKDGYTTHKVCSECGEKNGDYAVITAKGHDLETVKDTAATCTKNGTFEQKCKNCEYTNSETRKKTGHSYSDVAGQDPTCTEAGHSAYQKCDKCGKVRGKTSVAATGHTYVNGQCACGTAAPGYTGPAVPDASCTHASKSTYTTSPNCTNVGYTVVTCDTCHAELSREIVAAHGHTEKTVIKDSTCAADGYVRVYCAVCKDTISYTVLNHFGHNYVNGICTTCGDANSNQYTSDYQDFFIVG